MEASGAAHPSEHKTTPRGASLAVLSLAALGVVYGDIGTSPLYAVRECFHGTHPMAVTPVSVLGILSLIVWSLILIISVKYLAFILRADNRGEGGILALAALITPVRAMAERQRKVVLAIGLFGAALLYADGMITPAISVLSAVEGLKIAIPNLTEQFIDWVAVGILVGLFLLQSYGTERVGSLFGPIILIWFLTLAALGVWWISGNLSVLRAVNPLYALEFFRVNGWEGFTILGTVFLVVTGGEALYADIGHFGTQPIRVTWFAVVLPALLLNYFGQAAYVLSNPEGASHPFFKMAPAWALYPLVGLATMSAVIASQAVITGSYSLTLQAIQLGYVPRLTIEHTSHAHRGQIYIPVINWALMVASIGLVLGFHSSSNLAAAYGVAITVTMVITTVLFFVLLKEHWKWSLPAALALSGSFFIIELAFFGANMLKLFHGGWFPLVIGGLVYTIMVTWRRGRQIVAERLRSRLIPLELFLAELLSNPPPRVPGVAVFLFGNPVGTPPALRHNFIHNKVLHETVVIVSVETCEIPHVPAPDRVSIEQVGEGFWRVGLKYGFMDEPHVPRALQTIDGPELKLRDCQISYFLGRETLLATDRPGMALWRERLFALMSRNSQAATDFFKLPPDRVVELGVQVEL